MQKEIEFTFGLLVKGLLIISRIPFQYSSLDFVRPYTILKFY